MNHKPGQILNSRVQRFWPFTSLLLSYNYYRDYDTDTGRYLQPDPIGLDGGLNPYLYVNANPLAYIDPLGLDPGDLFATADDAFLDAKNYARRFPNQRIEYGGWVYKDGNCWTYNFQEGTTGGLDSRRLEEARPIVSRDIWHTHPKTGDPRRERAEESYSGSISGTIRGDLTTSRVNNVGIYLNTPRGANAYYDYRQNPRLRHIDDRDPDPCRCQ